MTSLSRKRGARTGAAAGEGQRLWWLVQSTRLPLLVMCLSLRDQKPGNVFCLSSFVLCPEPCYECRQKEQRLWWLVQKAYSDEFDWSF